MSYQLGIDLGTTYTAAAVCRSTDRKAADPEVVALGSRAAAVPSVLYVAPDGTLLVGEVAQRRAVSEPDRVVREFKRRIGDVTPVVVGGVAHHAHDLAAQLVRWVVDQVAEREGGPASRIAVTHPASWGEHKKQLVAEALGRHGLRVAFLAEPQAAAVSYAAAARVEPGSTIAVYDLGGGTFDAAVVRKGSSGFELLGRPEGIERLGGVDFDELVLDHVRAGFGTAWEALDPADQDVLAAVARLRQDCVEAKEALSSDTEVSIPVLLPGTRGSARLVRREFEDMVRPALEDTVVALRRAVTSASLTPADLSAVLLVGGSSRIPLVSQMVSAELGRPVAVDADPKYAIALGAALAVSPRPAASWPAVVVPPVPPVAASPRAAATPVPPPPTRPDAPAASGDPTPVGPRTARRPAVPAAPHTASPHTASPHAPSPHAPSPHAPSPHTAPPRPAVAAPAPLGRSGAGRAGAAAPAEPREGRAAARPIGPLVGVGGLVAAIGLIVMLVVWNGDAPTPVPTPVGVSTSTSEPPANPVAPVDAGPAPGGGDSSPQSGAGNVSPVAPTQAPPTSPVDPPVETEPPVTDPPVTDPPATDPPVTDPPATDPPSDTDPPSETEVTPVADSPEPVAVTVVPTL